MRLSRVGILSLLVLAGCNQPQSGATIPEPKPQAYWADIPVPKKFNRDEKKSTYSTAAGKRMIDDIYVGPDSTMAVRNFYSHNMTIAGWQPPQKDAENLQNGVYTLNFRKGDEHAEIRIERIPAAIMGQRTQIRARVNATNP